MMTAIQPVSVNRYRPQVSFNAPQSGQALARPYPTASHRPEALRFGVKHTPWATLLLCITLISGSIGILQGTTPQATEQRDFNAQTFDFSQNKIIAREQYLSAIIQLYNSINRQFKQPTLSAQDQAKLMDLSHYSPEQLAFIDQQAQLLHKDSQGIMPDDQVLPVLTQAYNGFLENIVMQQLPDAGINATAKAQMEQDAQTFFHKAYSDFDSAEMATILGIFSAFALMITQALPQRRSQKE